MKKILMSLFTIAIVGTLLTGGAIAFFSDTEKATGNTFSAGTIDIEVNNHNPWTESFTLADFKPSETAYINFTVKNVGGNPAVIWKMITVTAQVGGTHPKSEDSEDPSDSINNLKSWILYDLDVVGVGWIIPPANKVRLDNVENVWIKLGTLAIGASMRVSQSYHLSPETTNWAQGDTMTFDITLMATQTNAPSLRPASGSAQLVSKDAFWQPGAYSGTLTYAYSGTTLTGSFTGTVPLANTLYKAIYYPDPWPGTGGSVLGTATSVGNNITMPFLSGSGIPVGGDLNQPAGIKVWLVPATDHDGGKMTAWNRQNYLFELNLVPVP